MALEVLPTVAICDSTTASKCDLTGLLLEQPEQQEELWNPGCQTLEYGVKLHHGPHAPHHFPVPFCLQVASDCATLFSTGKLLPLNWTADSIPAINF